MKLWTGADGNTYQLHTSWQLTSLLWRARNALLNSYLSRKKKLDISLLPLSLTLLITTSLLGVSLSGTSSLGLSLLNVTTLRSLSLLYLVLLRLLLTTTTTIGRVVVVVSTAAMITARLVRIISLLRATAAIAATAEVGGVVWRGETLMAIGSIVSAAAVTTIVAVNVTPSIGNAC